MTADLGADMHIGPETRVHRFIHSATRRMLRVLGQILFRVDIVGAENVPDGPFIISGVHRSNLDGLLTTLVTRREQRYMVKDSMWKIAPIGWWFSTVGCFAVRRERADRAALKEAGKALDEGFPLVVFPEGRRQDGPLLSPLFDGPAYLSHRHGVPILPLGIGGSARAMPKSAKWLRPSKIVLVVGEPFQVPEREGRRVDRSVIDAGTDNLAVRLQAAFDEAQELAGTPNVVELAVHGGDDEPGAA